MTQTGIEVNKPWLGGFGIGGDPDSWSPKTWEFLIETFDIKSVLDIGCGEGHHSKWFLHKGLNVTAIDGSTKAMEGMDENVLKIFKLHDFTQGPISDLKKYDLGWSIEFVEHVEEKYIQNFIDAFKKCKYVCMSHALPNQGGYHHVNEKPEEYWVNVMEKNGFKFLKSTSYALREYGDGGYIKRTGLIFKNLNK